MLPSCSAATLSRHEVAGDARDPGRVEPGVAHVLIETQNRGRHLAGAGEPHMAELDEAEFRVGFVPDQRKRIAADHLGEFDERRIRVLVMVLHDPDRAHPQHVDLAGGERRLGLARSGRRQQLDLQPLGGVGAGRVRRVERRVQHEAVILDTGAGGAVRASSVPLWRARRAENNLNAKDAKVRK